MSTAERTETKPDPRVRVAGHPLPWRCVHCEEEGDLLFIDDADGKAVFANLDHRHRDKDGEPIVPDSFFEGLVNDVNRMGEVQAYLSGLTSLTIKRHPLKLEPGFVDPEKEKQAFQNLERMGFMEARAPWDEVKAHTDPAARIAALEAALIRVATMFTSDWGTDFETSEVAETRAILTDLGLAQRFGGNPSEAEEAVSS